MHATTVAKIEAGKRSVRINEAVGIADLFQVSVDALLGRKEPDDTTLTFAMTVLMGYVQDAQDRIGAAQGFVTDVLDQLDGAKEQFDAPGLEAVHRTTQGLARRLESAQTEALKITALATDAMIAESAKSPHRRRPSR